MANDTEYTEIKKTLTHTTQGPVTRFVVIMRALELAHRTDNATTRNLIGCVLEDTLDELTYGDR